MAIEREQSGAENQPVQKSIENDLQQHRISARLSEIERALGIVDEGELKEELAKQGFSPDAVKQEIRAATDRGIFQDKPFWLRPYMPWHWESTSTVWNADFGFFGGIPTVFVSKSDRDIISLHFMSDAKDDGSMVGFGWEPRYLSGPMLGTRYRYPQLFFVPLALYDHRDPRDRDEDEEIGVCGEVLVGPAPADAKIYLPQKPWLPQDLKGPVIQDALRESIERATGWESRNNWRLYFDNNKSALPTDTVRILNSLLEEENI